MNALLEPKVLQRSLLSAADEAGIALTPSEANAYVHRAVLTKMIISAKYGANRPELCTTPASSETPASLAAGMRRAFGYDDVEPLAELDQVALPLGLALLEPVVNLSVVFYLGAVTVLFVRSDSPTRSLYSAAWMIGWSLARRKNSSKIEIVSSKDSRSPRRSFAKKFANNLLVPPTGLGIALREIRRLLRVNKGAIGDIELLYLARIFGVPFEVAAARCEEEGLIPKGGTLALVHHQRQSFGREEARADSLGLPPARPYSLPALPAGVAAAMAAMSAERPTVLDISLADLMLQESSHE